MSLVVRVDENDQGRILAATAPLKIVQDLTTELDSGNLTYYINESDAKGTVEPLSPYLVTVRKSNANPTSFAFVGMDSRAIVSRGENGQSLYQHQVNLTERAKLLQGALIDGFGVAQPEDYSSRKSLLQVVQRLLAVTPLKGSHYSLISGRVRDILSEVKSPEFKFESQSTLWECLVKIGAVVDAIPRLETGTVTFDFVNDYSNEVASIVDEYSNTLGENTEENQYNTSLGSVVENVREK